MKITRRIFSDLAELILEGGARKATKYFSETQVVKVTRRLYDGKIDKRDKRIEVLFTIGTPNYTERQFIKQAKKAGESFPIKKTRIVWYKPMKGK